MGSIWMAHWCYRCVHDHVATHVGEQEARYEDGCQYLCLLLAGEEPDVFLSHEEPNDGRSPGAWSPDLYECRMFERCPCRDNPGWEPPVKPTPDPNQGLLWEVVDETPFTPMLLIPADEPAEALR